MIWHQNVARQVSTEVWSESSFPRKREPRPVLRLVPESANRIPAFARMTTDGDPQEVTLLLTSNNATDAQHCAHGLKFVVLDSGSKDSF